MFSVPKAARAAKSWHSKALRLMELQLNQTRGYSMEVFDMDDSGRRCSLGSA